MTDMNTFERQENDPRIRKLRERARRLGVPRVEEHEWARIETQVFDAIDPVAVRRSAARSALLRFRPAMALMALFVLAAGAAYLWRLGDGGSSDIPLAGRLIVEGLVEMRNPSEDGGAASGQWRPLDGRLALRAGCEIRTAENAYMSMTIDSATGFALGQLSQAVVTNARVEEQYYELTRGIIRVQLARSAREQSLVVLTPNAECRAVGTVYTVACDSVAAGAVTTVSVGEGTVHVRSRISPEEWREVTAPGAVRLVGGRFESIMAHMLVDTGAEDGHAADDSMVSPVNPLDEPQPLQPDIVPVPRQPVQLPAMELPPVAMQLPRNTSPDEPTTPPAPDTVPSGGRPAVDSAYIAGTLLGRPLYWRYDLVRLDTLGGRSVLRRAGVDDNRARDVRSPRELARALNAADMKLLRLRDANAMALALLQQLGYHVVCLTQWSCEIEGSWPGDNRDYIEDDVAFSDVYWE
ncbi:MAG: hypothetical protein GF331_22935, partial [Chitinivibrionales bacterium]|nr:hypothetical protein [Chitinivibrionales bacterium]